MAALTRETLPKALDIVWSRFPYEERPGMPADKPHPALVFAVFERTGGLFSVQVAYGTSNLKTDTRPFDFRIQNYRAMHYAGLHQATRFDLDRIKWLPWDSDWFQSPNAEKYPTPVIGHLIEDPIARLKNLLRVRADNDMPVPFRPTPAP